jgi:hypothetical protein
VAAQAAAMCLSGPAWVLASDYDDRVVLTSAGDGGE